MQVKSSSSLIFRQGVDETPSFNQNISIIRADSRDRKSRVDHYTGNSSILSEWNTYETFFGKFTNPKKTSSSILASDIDEEKRGLISYPQNNSNQMQFQTKIKTKAVDTDSRVNNSRLRNIQTDYQKINGYYEEMNSIVMAQNETILKSESFLNEANQDVKVASSELKDANNIRKKASITAIKTLVMLCIILLIFGLVYFF